MEAVRRSRPALASNGLPLIEMVVVPEPSSETGTRAADVEQAARLARLIRKQSGFVWRLLRCIGVTESEADSAVREVFVAARERIGDIRSGSERSFLFGTALHVASRVRKNREGHGVISDGAPALEDLDESRQAREILGALLEQMPLELRVVFVLSEIEQLALAEIAVVVGIPPTTVETRLREAQDDFATHLESGSELSLSLISAARDEQPSADALASVYASAGLDATLIESDAEAAALSSPTSGRAAALAKRSPAALIVTWIVLGWLVGLVAGLMLYALSDAVAARSNAAAR